MVVGDQYQAIFGFTGVDADKSLAEIPKLMFGAKKHRDMVLSNCRRCPSDIISLAKTLVGDAITPVPDAPAGSIVDVPDFDFEKPEGVLQELAPGDLVLLESNRDAAALAFKCAKMPGSNPAGLSCYASFKREMIRAIDTATKKHGKITTMEHVLKAANSGVPTLLTSARKTDEWGDYFKVSHILKTPVNHNC